MWAEGFRASPESVTGCAGGRPSVGCMQCVAQAWPLVPQRLVSNRPAPPTIFDITGTGAFGSIGRPVASLAACQFDRPGHPSVAWMTAAGRARQRTERGSVGVVGHESEGQGTRCSVCGELIPRGEGYGTGALKDGLYCSVTCVALRDDRMVPPVSEIVQRTASADES